MATASHSEENLEYSSRRTRTLTEKGLSYSRQQLCERLPKSWKYIQSKIEHILPLLEVSHDVSVIEVYRHEVDNLLVEYESLNTSYKSLLTEDEQEKYDVEIQERECYVADFKTKLYHWLRMNRSNDHAQSIMSVRSRSTHKSSRASSTASQRAMRQAAKVAALEASRGFAAEEAQLEHRQFESAQQAKNLKMEREMAVARAELSVYKHYEALESGECSMLPGISSMSQADIADIVSVNQRPLTPQYTVATMSSQCPPTVAPGACEPVLPISTNSVSLSTGPCVMSAPSFNPLVPPPPIVSQPVFPPLPNTGFPPHSVAQLSMSGVPGVLPQPCLTQSVTAAPPHIVAPAAPITSSMSGGLDGDERFVITLSDALKQNNLPKLELSVFSGDCLEFQRWLVSFEKIIEDSTMDPVKRLHYLLQYTSGNAKILVSGHALNQTAEGYNAAKAELVKEFGNAYAVSRAYMKRIESWKSIPVSDVAGLKAFSVFLKSCKGSMPSLKHLQQLDTDLYLQKIVSKLSVPLQNNWRKHVDSLEQRGNIINFAELVDFVDREARIAKHPVFSFESLQDSEGRVKSAGDSKAHLAAKPKAKAVMATSITTADHVKVAAAHAVQQTMSHSCPRCTKAHDLDACPDYLCLPVEDRRKFLISKRLCFGCYNHTSKNHDVRNCRRRRKCGECGKLHPTGLHGYKPVQPSRQSDITQSVSSNEETAVKLASYVTSTQPGAVAMSIVLVKVRHEADPRNEVITYAALDSMSSSSFVSEDVCRQLCVKGELTEITIKTMNSERSQMAEVVTGLQIAPMNGNESVSLMKAYTQELIPVSTDEIPSLDIIESWPHISHLASQFEPRNPNLHVGLLIGANCPKALEPRDVIPSESSGPFAVKTLLGWSISGPICPRDGHTCHRSQCSVTCHRALVHESRTQVVDTGLKDMLIQMHDLDFTERNTCLPALSRNDKKFLDMMEAEVQMIDGHYELPLPFVQPDVSLPYNKGQVVKRAEGLKRRLKANKKLHDDYRKFMEDMINKGYVEEVPDSGGSKVKGTWFIPHHGVYHPLKPEKIRVVFDCSCQCNGTSINKMLLQGPDLTNSLVGVLCRFRQEPVAVTADIESMFYQVRIPEAQRDYLRFVWWPNGEITSEPKEFRMCVHVFGAVSSPSCANFALRRTAMDNEVKFGTVAANTLRRNFYVDDMLKSVANTEAAITLVSEVKQMCSAGGFRLTKFLSNSREVLETIPPSEHAKNIVNIDLSQCSLPVERTLGVLWCIENDTIGFRIVLKDKPLTRRGVLSTISSVYDPLGLAAPFLLKGKKLLQTLCQSKLDWDDPLDEEYRVVWEHWRSYLPLLEQIQVSRCFMPNDFGHPITTQIHHFSDASLYGYGQCSYLRLISAGGRIHCSLIMGKSRVSPLKQFTIPRLELTAATVSAKVSHMLQEELDYLEVTNIFWTDSKAVLGYIGNDARRFHTFVANRVQLIRDLSDVNQWQYIESDTNPADDASRGLDCHNISSSHRWFIGPDFLWKPENQWTTNSCTAAGVNNYDADSDPEVKKSVVACTLLTSVKNDILDRLLEYHSSWYKLKKAVAWIIVVKTQLVRKAKKLLLRDFKLGLTVEELQAAEVAVMKYVQQQTFPEEISAMKARQSVKKSSKIYRLSPSLTADGLLCVEGRLRNCTLPISSKFPVILPSGHHVTVLLIRYFHEQYGHVGKEFVLSLLREHYWVINARRAIRQVLRDCITCRRAYSQPAVQRMADLPVDRVTPDKPPFTFTGLDFFGPFLVKVGRSMVKRYGCIFTCLAMRAVHIEVAHSMEADSFIHALHRFVARRGKPYEIRSDNGTNFVAGERELREAVQSWNKSRTQEFLRQNEIRWKFNPPTASHMGGIWERQIRTVRKIMSALTNQQQLTDESLQTLLCVIENIINSRPLTAVSDDPNDLEPLTPNHLLQLRSGPSLPPGDFVKQDVYCRQRWRQIQYLADVFWRRWTKEYLQNLQLRSKWLHEQPNVKLNDVVLVADDNLPRHCWSLGRVVKSLPGRDGLVRTVEVKTRTGVYTRPIHKLCLLESAIDC